MPNTKSAIRRVRRVKKQTQINRIRKSKYKNAVKQMELLIKSKDKVEAKDTATGYANCLFTYGMCGNIGFFEGRE